MNVHALAVAGAILLGGCTAPTLDVIDAMLGTDISDAAMQATANAVDRHCMLVGGNREARRETLRRINELTVVGDVSPFDCDSDGRPDY